MIIKSGSSSKTASSKASKTPRDPHEERQKTAQELAEVMEARRLIERYGKDGALRIVTLVRLMCGDLKYGREINDEEPLLQMHRLIETTRDAKGRRLHPWPAALEVAETMPGHNKLSTAKRLAGKYNRALVRQSKIDDLFS
jgi:hypothetical protein